MANILVIDAESVLLDLISNTLRLDGHSLTALSSPLAALGARAAGIPPIDLLLTEIDMKPISGFELVRRLSKAGFHGAVLFMSVHSALAASVAETLGDRVVLEKPFTAQQLRTAVKRALGKGSANTSHGA